MKRILSVLICLALTLALFAGCQSSTSIVPRVTPMTAEDVFEAMKKQLEPVRSFAMDLDAEFGLTVNVEEPETIELRLRVPGELILSPFAWHAKGTVAGKMTGELGEQIDLEFYALDEEGKLAIYVASDQEDFVRLEMDMPGKEDERQTEWEELSWELQTEENEYVLTHVFTEEEAKAFQEKFGDAVKVTQSETLEEMKELYDGLLQDVLTGFRIELRVDRSSMELRKLRLDLSEPFEAVIDRILSTVGSAYPTDGTETQFEDIVQNCRMVLEASFHDYDSVAPIAAPTDYEDMGDLKQWLSSSADIPGGDDFDVGPMLDELDDQFRLEDCSFCLSEVTPRDFETWGWTASVDHSFDYPVEDYDDEEASSDPEPADAAGSPDDDRILEPGETCDLMLTREGDDVERPFIELDVVNISNEPMSCFDCKITQISINSYEKASGSGVDFTGPGSVINGMTRTLVRELLGEPYYSYSFDEYGACESYDYYSTGSRMLLLMYDAQELLYGLTFIDYNALLQSGRIGR